MAKELPKIYSEKIDHDTNEKVVYTKSDEVRNVKETKKEMRIEKSIEQKINEIFHHVNYVYKIETIIETAEGKKNVQLVGRTKDYVITIDNEQIPITSIQDIYLK